MEGIELFLAFVIKISLISPHVEFAFKSNAMRHTKPNEFYSFNEDKRVKKM